MEYIVISLIAMIASYWAGQRSILDEFEDYKRKRRERDQRWREFNEEED